MHLETFLSEDLNSDVIDMMIRAQSCARNAYFCGFTTSMHPYRYHHDIQAALWDLYAVHNCRSIRGAMLGFQTLA